MPELIILYKSIQKNVSCLKNSFISFSAQILSHDVGLSSSFNIYLVSTP